MEPTIQKISEQKKCVASVKEAPQELVRNSALTLCWFTPTISEANAPITLETSRCAVSMIAKVWTQIKCVAHVEVVVMSMTTSASTQVALQLI